MGGFHICFNFLKVLANTWIVKDWITYVLRQVYIQPIPFRLCWMERRPTALSQDTNLHMKVSGTPRAQCSSHGLLDMAMNMMWQLKRHSDSPNFRLWSTYMNMVEILLDFIRGEMRWQLDSKPRGIALAHNI